MYTLFAKFYYSLPLAYMLIETVLFFAIAQQIELRTYRGMRIDLDMSKGTRVSFETEPVALKETANGSRRFQGHIMPFRAVDFGTRQATTKGGANGCSIFRCDSHQTHVAPTAMHRF